MVQTLVIKATGGANAPDRCARAFDVATRAASQGTRVSFWLAGEASWFALPGRVEAFELPNSRPLRELFATLMDGSKITLCRHCAARREITPGALLPGVRMAGAAVFVEECLDATQAVVL